MPNSKKLNAAALAASRTNAPESSAGAAKKSAASGKRSLNRTVGARHAVPERPSSTAPPSSISSRHRVKAPHTGEKRKRKRSKLPSPAALNGALELAFGDATIVAAAPSASIPTSSPATPAAAPSPVIDARPVSAAPPPRIRIGDAMRRTGLDEYKVARTLNGVVDKLSDGKAPKDTGGVQELLVDVLKECSRHLDPPQSERAAPAAPAHITMVHFVPRPVRTQSQTPPQQQQLGGTPEAAQPAEPSDASQ